MIIKPTMIIKSIMRINPTMITKPIRHGYILPIIGHGSTDIFDMPIITILSHILSVFIIKPLNFSQRKNLLLSISILHISRDIPLISTNIFNNYLSIIDGASIIYPTLIYLLISTLFHILWLRFNNIAKLYLIFIHTPLHYIKTFKNSMIIGKLSIATITTLFSYYILNNNIDLEIKDKYGELWWLAPILGHIIIDELIMIKSIGQIM